MIARALLVASLVTVAAGLTAAPELVDNPGFELPPAGDEGAAVAPGWQVDIRSRDAAEVADASACSARRDDRAPHSGGWCLRLEAGGGLLTQLWAEPEIEGERGRLIPVEGGRRYDFSYWARVPDPGTILVGHVIFYDADRRALQGRHARLKTSADQTGDRWLRFERSVPIEEEATFAVVHFACGWGSGGRQTAWLDDVQFSLHE